jgi:hypothetical protein
MKCIKVLATSWTSLVAVMVGWFSIFAMPAAGQSAGQNGVYNSIGACSPCGASSAFIDASMFAFSGGNFCSVLKSILTNTSYPAAGAVIDARGLLSSTPPTSMTCAAGPWAGISSPPPATILLPAGTIVISHPGWTVPANTRLIGVGNDDVATGSGTVISGTIIQACKSGPTGCTAFSSGDTMLTMCNSACSGVSVENLSLDGQGLSINGIANAYAAMSSATASSYVKNVTLFQILGTGLSVTGSTQGSGPYTNITFDTDDAVGSSTNCLNITASATQGFHGVTCSSTNAATSAVLLDASNTSLTDVQIIGFINGILVGSRSAAFSDVLRNVWGDTNAKSTSPIQGVVILSSNAKDVAVVGTGNLGGNPTISDTLTMTTLYDSYVGIYALGEPVMHAGYSRFTTSTNNDVTNGNGTDTNAVTWGTGSSAPTGSGCAEGSLYSCTGANCNTSSACSTNSPTAALWVCGNQSGTTGWCAIK